MGTDRHNIWTELHSDDSLKGHMTVNPDQICGGPGEN